MAFGVPKPSRNIGGSFFRYLRWLGYTVVGVVVLLAIAPLVIAKTGLSTWLINRSLGGLPISVSVGSLSLGWFSHVAAQNVVLRDADGAEFAKVERVSIDRTLWNLVITSSDLGKIRVERPSADIVFTNETSNLEKIFHQTPKNPANKKPPAPQPRGKKGTTFALEVVEGTVRVVDADAKASWQLANLDIRMSNDNAGNMPLKGRVTAAVTGANEAGSVAVDIKGTTTGTVSGLGQMKLQSVPLSLLTPLLRRGQPGFQCDGRLQTNGFLQWSIAPDNTLVLAVRGRLDGENLEAKGGVFGEDRAVLRSLTVPFFEVDYNGSQLVFDCKDLTCDVGRATAAGKMTFQKSLLDNLSEPGTSISLDVNLAEVAQRIPKTLRLHKDVSLTAGRLKFEGKSVIANGKPLWEGDLKTTDISGMRGNTLIAWKEPLSLVFKIRQTDRSWPDIQELRCQSRFITIDGSASATHLRLTAHADLGQLATQMGQFADLGAWPLAGQAEASLAMKMPDPNYHVIDASVALDRFQWGPWREEQLSLKADAEVKSAEGRHTIDKSASLRVTSGADVLEFTLREPVVMSQQGQAGSVYLKLDGDLARWQQRVKSFVPAAGDIALEGQAKGQAWINLAARKVDVQSIVLAVQNFGMKLGSVTVRDPNLEVQASLVYNADQGSLDVKDSQARSQGLVLHTPKLHVDLDKKMMTGSVVYRGDLAKLQGWFAPPTAGADVWAGSLFGQADLVSNADGFSIDAKSTLKGVTLGPAAGPPRLNEPVVQLNAKGNFASKPGVLQLDAIQLTSQLGSIAAQAKLGKLDTVLDIEMTGTLSYDLAQAEALAKSYLGAGARIQGKDRREFRVAGPLRPKGSAPGATMELTALQGNAAVSWQQLVGYGAIIGPADVKANLQGGSIKIDPIATSINQGKLRFAPNLRFDPVGELTLPAGPVVENAKITPEMCASALGYTLPMLANVAQAEGELSLTIDGARVPFGDAKNSQFSGILRLHHAKVGPSQLVKDLTGLLKTATPYSVIRDNQVKIKLEKGRVYHENLELVLPDNITVRSSGSVGLDGTLDMIAEVPLPQRLVGNVKIPVEIARTPIRLPITGTVDHPRIDSRGLTDALKNATLDAANDILKKGLDKLLRPKK